MPWQWRVIGGAKGGIVVRTGPELKAPEAPARLAHGAVVEELALQGDRLQYRKVEGEGPETGWVSLRFKGSDLLARPFDIIVYGCTGLVGHWASRWLSEVEGLRWCVAGRDPGKVQQVADEFAVDVMLAADDEPPSFERLAARTKVVLALAGPYRRPWGKMLATACARRGTHWVDITGETSFVRECIDELHETAVANRSVLVHGCGVAEIFYSDLATNLVLRHLREEKGASARRVEVMSFYMGGASGGTMESGLAMREQVPKKVLCDPFYLAQESNALVGEEWLDDDDENWLDDFEETFEHPNFGILAPHGLANGNTRLLRRSLLSYALAKRHYGPEGHEAQIAIRLYSMVNDHEAASRAVQDLAGSWMKDAKGKMRARSMIEMGVMPKIGQGPSEEVSKAVRCVEFVVAESTDGQKAHCSMRCGLRNWGEACGYAGTALCAAMAALCLALESEQRSPHFGCLTPAYALEGTTILDRALAKGVEFQVKDGLPSLEEVGWLKMWSSEELLRGGLHPGTFSDYVHIGAKP